MDLLSDEDKRDLTYGERIQLAEYVAQFYKAPKV
jgi:uncharacterized protein YciW